VAEGLLLLDRSSLVLLAKKPARKREKRFAAAAAGRAKTEAENEREDLLFLFL
jgi:hypothetical protein